MNNNLLKFRSKKQIDLDRKIKKAEKLFFEIVLELEDLDLKNCAYFRRTIKVKNKEFSLNIFETFNFNKK